MIRPEPLGSEQSYGPWSCRGSDIWETMCAARDGDVGKLRALLARDPNLHRAEYWYTQPIHFAVREGQLEALRLLLRAGADPSWRGLSGESLESIARDRGHASVVRELARATPAAADVAASTTLKRESPLHQAAEAGDLARVREWLASDPLLLHAGDHLERTPLHRAVIGASAPVVELLLQSGADPNWPEGPAAPRGGALHTASRTGQVELVKTLLGHGADPNATIDSSGSATWTAATPELRQMLIEHGGGLDPHDRIFLDDDEAALRNVEVDLDSAQAGCGGALAAACTLGKRDLVVRLLALGVRVPAFLTECRSYLWCDPDLLRLLLESGMDPDLPDWLHATPLHSLCDRDSRGRARPHRIECARLFLDAGANLTARDEDYQSTPLGWAARNGLDDMLALLLERGAPTELADDPAWATPLAWARRRGHREAERILLGQSPA